MPEGAKKFTNAVLKGRMILKNNEKQTGYEEK
jgi:hypothetical protein